VSAVFYCWSVYKKQAFYSQKQKCIERCYSKIKEDPEIENISRVKIMEKCEEVCNYLPNFFE